MNKKIILSKTIVFVCIVGFITLFKTIFGAENALIGVTSITALLMFLERDLTIAPWKNTMKLIGLNLFIGCTATLASTNMWIAIPVNFMAIFILGHSLLYNLKKPMYLPFILQYLFILASPVPAEKLPMRLLALIVGAVTIMGMQLLTNKGKLTKTGEMGNANDDKLMTHRNKWLIAHEDAHIEGAFVGLVGENIEIR